MRFSDGSISILTKNEKQTILLIIRALTGRTSSDPRNIRDSEVVITDDWSLAVHGVKNGAL